MNTKKIIVSTLVIALSIGGFTSCKKKGCTDSAATNYNAAATSDDGSCEFVTTPVTPTPSATAPGGYSPTFTGSYGLLVGIKSLSTTSVGGINIDTSIGTAVATFSNDGGVTNETAGGIDANGDVLTMQTNNSYVFTPGVTMPTGITFTSPLAWTGTGATWPAFTASTSIGFAVLDDFTPAAPSTSADYTVTATAISNADSIYYSVIGPNGTLYFVEPAGTMSHTFLAADMATIGAGTGYVQIVGINYDPQTIGGNSYWIMNETVRTKSVTIN
ncbi:MAG TPA: hypothetical protein EYG86_06940 [Crocinitomicaceae bacterium]|nr:hypothetical protein [Crocinitomicaceae bacterium]